jgi:hypothetical protein
MEQKQSNPLVQYGILSGLAGVLLFLALYVGGAKLFVSPVAYLGYVIPIVFAVLACLKLKKNRGGYLEFGEALKTSFGVFVITSLISTLVTYIMMNFVDKEFAQALQQESMAMVERMMKRFGASQDQIDKAVSDAANTNPYSFGKLLLGFAFSCLLWFLLSLIISLIVRKKRPEHEMPNSI